MRTGYHHARYIEPHAVYHVLSRTIEGQMRFRPDRGGCLEKITYGVLAKALSNYPGIKLYNFALLSNHCHIMLSTSDSKQFPAFVRYIKSELSRRWAPHIRRSGPQWDPSGYKCTMLPTLGSQRRCFRYVLSQGVKEGLVRSPVKWPSAHGAKYWLGGQRPLVGYWENGTVRALAKAQGKRLKESDYREEVTLSFDKLPGLDVSKTALKRMLADIVNEGRKLRRGRKPLTRDRLYQTSPTQRKSLPHVPWLLKRGTIVAWVSDTVDAARQYIERYFEFQRRFRIASDAYLKGNASTFPIYARVPTKTVF